MNIFPQEKYDPTPITPLLKSLGHVGVFGEIIFEVSGFKVMTFDEYKRESKARFAEHKLLKQVPQLEYIGEGLEEISLKIKLVRSLGVNPEKEFEKLRRKLRQGEAEYLVIGAKVIGDNLWVIEELTESAQIFNSFGKILVSEVDVKFKEYRNAS